MWLWTWGGATFSLFLSTPCLFLPKIVFFLFFSFFFLNLPKCFLALIPRKGGIVVAVDVATGEVDFLVAVRNRCPVADRPLNVNVKREGKVLRQLGVSGRGLCLAEGLVLPLEATPISKEAGVVDMLAVFFGYLLPLPQANRPNRQGDSKEVAALVGRNVPCCPSPCHRSSLFRRGWLGGRRRHRSFLWRKVARGSVDVAFWPTKKKNRAVA